MMRRLGVAALLLMLMMHATAHAGSPWWVDINGSGVPVTWSGGQIVYVTDTGGLKPFTQADIVKKVEEAFMIWAAAGLSLSGSVAQTIPTVSLLPTLGGESGKKITLENLETFAKKGPIIVFDADGSLIEDILKIDPGLGIRAVTLIDGEADIDKKNLRLLRGTTILNGVYLKDAKSTDVTKDDFAGQFVAALVHEIGHLLNLDHSGLNAAQFTEIRTDLNARANELPTMFPWVEHTDQMRLHHDDIVAISNLYPRPELTTQFCTIAGTLLGNDGLGFQGAQVIARAVQDQMTVAVSAITGNSFPQGAADGSYILRGILPGKSYGVTYEELPKDFTGPSSIQPYGDDFDSNGELPRAGFGAGLITAGGGKTKTVQCLKAGETLLMDTVQFAIPSGATWKPAVQLVPSQNQPIMGVDGKKKSDGDGTSGGDDEASGGGCSLIP